MIDFIDMDSRRDQFQLLEHFTTAIKDDSARPQIAQLTELGLLELTRKRQGQNIYELFGKKFNQCDGLEQLKTLVDFEKESFENQKNSKKGKKNSNIEDSIIENKENNENHLKKEEKDINLVTNNIEEEISNKAKVVNDEHQNSSNSNEKEIIFIDLSDDEKIVYSQLGINPLIKLGKEYINATTIAQLESNSQKEAKDIPIQKKSKNKILNSNSVEDIKELNQSHKETDQKKLILDKEEEENKDQEKEIQEINSEDEIDISRRKRRRSSAASE